MRRQLACAVVVLLAAVAPSHAAVDLTGTWNICEDCRGFGVCDPLGPPQPNTDVWMITQTGTDLAIDSVFDFDLTGTIDTTSGSFVVPRPPNLIDVLGVGTFSTIDASYDSGLQSGHIFGARACDLMSPACDDGDTCTDDACVTTTVGTCVAVPVAICVNTQNGSCSTTTTTNTTTSTTTSSLPLGHYPVQGTKLVLKQNSKGRQTLIFVTKDPTVFVPTSGGPDDPTLVSTQIDVYSPADETSAFDIVIPPGVGNPGWQFKATPSPTYKFRNSAAPAGISVVRSVKLRQGKGLKIVARATGLPMTTTLGAAGISIRFDNLSGGHSIVCAHFGSASVRKDTPPLFVAGPSPAPVNCLSPTLRAP